MLYQYLRVIKNKNGTLTDLSLDNQDKSTSILLNLDVTTDYLYIGQFYPFNNFYFKKSSVNAVNSLLTVQYWDGSQWRDTVDLLDATYSSSKTLAKSGLIQFSPDYHYRWSLVTDTSLSSAPTDLQTLTIYNLYWARIKVSASLTGTTAGRIGYAFTNTQQINGRDRSIASYYTSFEQGKTNWEDEIMNASLDVISELKRKNAILNKGQILKIEDVSVATDYMTLKNIYNELGGDYKDKLDTTIKDLSNALDLKVSSFDLNYNGYLDQGEIDNSYNQSRASRC